MFEEFRAKNHVCLSRAMSSKPDRTRTLARPFVPLLTVAAGILTIGCASPGHRPTVPPDAPSSTTASAPSEPSFAPEERARIASVQPWVEQAASKHRLDPDLINGVIWVESRFDARAKSPAGARGLMQLMPATASELARKMGRHRPASYDPEFNIHAGSLYLARLLERYDGNEKLALAAYNAGAGNVDKWLAQGGLPPRSEKYVALVFDARARFKALREGSRQPVVEPPPEEEPTVIATPTPRASDPPRAAIETPPPVVPEAPVRYDLDRVESTYRPTPPEEPPLAETPYPRETRTPPAVPMRPGLDAEDATEPPPTPAKAAPAGTGLPSVLD